MPEKQTSMQLKQLLQQGACTAPRRGTDALVAQQASHDPDDRRLIPASAAIEAKGIAHRLQARGRYIDILDGIDLKVEEKEFVAIVGPSGCGKTMFLNMVAGLEPTSQGMLSVLGGKPVAGSRYVAYCFARDALLPWRVAGENVALALQLRGVGPDERRARSMAMLEAVGLGDAYDRYRAELSQGMRQRVALARTFVTRPQLLLLDEPFAALDAQTRISMQALLLQLVGQTECTVLLVTHDLNEAITLADRVIVFSKRPARIKKEVHIGFGPEQRVNIAALHESTEFAALHHVLWSELATELLPDTAGAL